MGVDLNLYGVASVGHDVAARDDILRAIVLAVAAAAGCSEGPGGQDTTTPDECPDGCPAAPASGMDLAFAGCDSMYNNYPADREKVAALLPPGYRVPPDPVILAGLDTYRCETVWIGNETLLEDVAFSLVATGVRVPAGTSGGGEEGRWGRRSVGTTFRFGSEWKSCQRRGTSLLGSRGR